MIKFMANPGEVSILNNLDITPGKLNRGELSNHQNYECSAYYRFLK